VLRALAVLMALAVLPCGCAWLGPALGRKPAIDIVILTVLESEYAVAMAQVKDLSPIEGPGAQRYRWMLGEIESDTYGRAFRVLVGMTGDKGEVAGALATRATIARWDPDTVLLVGIAGGIGGAASLGDVVLPTTIWNYEVGHLGSGFTPKLTVRFEPDPALLQAAMEVAPDWPQAIRAKPPGPLPPPRVVSGVVASGDKVIESKGSELYSDVAHAEPDIVAVEMEGAGAAAAIRDASEEGHDTTFMMVRGISDVIRANPEGEERAGETYVDPERERWRNYAAQVAAAFAAELIRTRWPTPPR
jgi:adenosylhomocysteine nucleosidase